MANEKQTHHDLTESLRKINKLDFQGRECVIEDQLRAGRIDDEEAVAALRNFGRNETEAWRMVGQVQLDMAMDYSEFPDIAIRQLLAVSAIQGSVNKETRSDHLIAFLTKLAQWVKDGKQ